jgi:hypothetical protein
MPHDAKGHKRYDFGMRRLRGLAFGVIVVALTVGVIAGVVTAVQHIPRPATKIEWVQRADAIIVQRKTVEPAQGGFSSWTALPDFTLYGDGTLILASPKDPTELAQTRLPEDAVRDLVEFVDGTGFFNFDFNFAQPNPTVLGHEKITYLYVALKDRANAVAVYAIATDVPNGNDWVQFRKLHEINERLNAIDPAALGGDAPMPYHPDAFFLFVQPTYDAGVAGSPEWPFGEIDLNAIAPTSSGQHRRIEGDTARFFVGADCPGSFKQGDRYFFVCYRPALPYEEAFPEFEPPP